jgi:hypothetical protein
MFCSKDESALEKDAPIMKVEVIKGQSKKHPERGVIVCRN